jgi:hypothetical protein
MFDKIQSLASSGKKSPAKGKAKKEQPRTNAFVGALKENGYRVSYGALAVASEALGEHVATGLSAGQRGSGICKNLPNDLQPNVCRANGGYAKDQSWPEAPDADVKALKAVRHIKPDAVIEFVEAFIRATDGDNEDEDVSDEEDADLDDDVDQDDEDADEDADPSDEG